MAKRLLTLFAAAAVLALVTPLSVTTSAAEMTYRIPFNFSVNGTTLPSGTYTITTRDSAMVIRGYGRGVVVMTGALDGHGRDGTGRAVFEVIGDRHVLREVWVTGRTGRDVPMSGQERALRLASNVPVERVVLLGL